MVVKGSLCSPSTPKIRVRIPLKPSVFSIKCVFEQNKNEQKEARVGPLLTTFVSKPVSDEAIGYRKKISSLDPRGLTESCYQRAKGKLS